MKSRILIRLLLLCGISFLLSTSITFGQVNEENREVGFLWWTGRSLTETDLDSMITEHELSVKHNGTKGSSLSFYRAYINSRAKLRKRILTGAGFLESNLSKLTLDSIKLNLAALTVSDLSEANLTDADLTEANLKGTDFLRAVLVRANLTDAVLGCEMTSKSGLKCTRLTGANLTRAKLTRVSLEKVEATDANFTDAEMSEVNLTGAILVGANLTGVSLEKVNVNDANFTNAEMHGVNLRQVDMSKANLSGANMYGVIYEPSSNPNVLSIASADSLEYLTYYDNPTALFQLRKQFQDNGFRTQERKVMYALKRREAEFQSVGERWFNTIAFDWTCQYGLNPNRALVIWVCIFFICLFINIIFIHKKVEWGIFLVLKESNSGLNNFQEAKINLTVNSSMTGLEYILGLFWAELKVFGWAFLFSLMSAFNIGFRDINFGRWLRLLFPTEFDLKAKGWARTVAGVQSLLSVFLVALWVLTYFGRPFE